MAIYSRDAEMDGGADRALHLASAGFVTLYYRPVVLDEMTRWLDANEYHVVRLDCASWLTEDAMHDAMTAAFGFPDYYGRNLDALNDCLSDVAAGSYGTDEAATGTVLVLTRFDVFEASNPYAAHTLLDIFAGQARGAALFGHRMLCLVQSDDPRLELAPVGATPVLWNPAEWLTSKRFS